MNTLSRKQREKTARHELLLSIAQDLMHAEGFNQITMERVAELAEYSKGTVYQHFGCKEQILVELCNQSMSRLLTLGRKAAAYPGNHRERMMCFFFANELWQQSNANDVSMMQNLHSDGVLNKVSVDLRAAHECLEQNIIDVVASIIQDAMNDGELPSEPWSPHDMVFALWSMCHGSQVLRSLGLTEKVLAISNPGSVICGFTQAALNGLGWQPLMNLEQTQALISTFESQYYKVELNNLVKQ